MPKARLRKRKVKGDEDTFDLMVGKEVRGRAIGKGIGMRFVRKLNKRRRK